MVELTLLLTLAAVVLVLMLFMGIAQPIWCIIDCAIDDRRSTISKGVWIVFLVLLWAITPWFYGALAATSSRLRRATWIAWLAAILMLIGFLLLPKPIRSELTRQIATAREDDVRRAASSSGQIPGDVPVKPRSLDLPDAKAPSAELLPDLRIERIVPASAGSRGIGRWFNVTVVNKGLVATPAPVNFHARALMRAAASSADTPLLVLNCEVTDVGTPTLSEPACPRASIGVLDAGARKTISVFVQGLAPRSGEESFRVELAVNPCKGAFAFGSADLPTCQVVESDTTNNIAAFDSALFQTARRDNIKKY